ncbi:MAG: maleylpyruvate isomerase family mycothiol-dependent enzyme [Rhodococcus sp. (in: high G+C Gram-positive bacteria)]
MNIQTLQTAPRRSALPRSTAMRLAATEYRRFADAVAELRPDDWAKPTDCTAWNVHQMVAHTVAMASFAASVREGGRQRKAAAERLSEDCSFIDALTAYQVDKYGANSPERLTQLMREVVPKAARGRRFTPRFIRNRTMPAPQVVNGVAERWTIGFLVDTILTRDPWMHRIDLARATGRPLVLTAEHDGVIVDDVVAEWAGRHGNPYRLTLTGPAGGDWSAGEDGAELTADAIEFCRTLSARACGDGLLSTQVPF